MAAKQTDPLDALIDRIAEAVVRKLDEKDKIDAIAEAVIVRLQDDGTKARPRGKARASSPTRKPRRASAARSPKARSTRKKR